MKNLSPENAIIGLQNALESQRTGQTHRTEFVAEYKASTAAENIYARVRQQGRRMSHRRNEKLVPAAEGKTVSDIAPPQRCCGE